MKRILQLGAISIANLASMILFQWLLITKLGASVESDALFAAMTIPQLFASVIAASLTSIVAPLLTGENSAEQRVDAWSLIAITSAIFTGMTILLILLAPWWTGWIAPGFSVSAKALLLHYSRINILVIIFAGFNAIQIGLAYARNQFQWVEFSAFIANLIAILLALFFVRDGDGILASWILVARAVLTSILLLKVTDAPARPDFSRPFIKQAWSKLKPVLIGGSYYKMDPVVDRILLSSLPAGSLSLFYIAQQILSAGSQVFAKVIATPTITKLAYAFKSGDETEYSRIYRHNMLLILGLSTCGLIAGIGFIYLLLPYFESVGNFSVADAQYIVMILTLAGGMMVAGAGGSLVAGAYYARGDTKTPTIIGSISFTIGIGLKIVTFRLFGLEGLAIGVSIYYTTSLILQGLYLRRRNGVSPAS